MVIQAHKNKQTDNTMTQKKHNDYMTNINKKKNI